MVDPTRKRYGYREVAAELRAEIAAGKYADGQLPTQAELGERFGVSRMTVSQALGELRQDQMIVSVQGKGVFVFNRDDVPPQAARSGVMADLADPQGPVLYSYFPSLSTALDFVESIEVENPRLNPVEWRVLVRDVEFDEIHAAPPPGVSLDIRMTETTMQPMIRLTDGQVVISLAKDFTLSDVDETLWADPHKAFRDVVLHWMEQQWMEGSPVTWRYPD